MLHNLSHHGKDIERRLISRIGSLGPELEPGNQRIVSSRARGGISNRFEVAVVANPSATGTEGSLSVVRAGIWLRERTTEMGHGPALPSMDANGCCGSKCVIPGPHRRTTRSCGLPTFAPISAWPTLFLSHPQPAGSGHIVLLPLNPWLQHRRGNRVNRPARILAAMFQGGGNIPLLMPVACR